MQANFPNNLRLGLYARVSGEEQRQGQTIDSQIAELTQFSNQSLGVIQRVYKDDGWSGAILARPSLDQLRDDARRGLFDAVLVNDVDRLARDVAHLAVIKRDLESVGVKLIFRKLPTEGGPMGNLMVNILGSFAEFEREIIADRTRRGRRHKVEVRKEFIGALAPYGFRYSRRDKVTGAGGLLSICPKEAAVVRDIFRWVDRESLSARKVVARLNEVGIPTSKRSGPWQRSTVLRLLRNETYAGVWHFYKHERREPLAPTAKRPYRRQIKTSLRRRPRPEWLPVILPEGLRIIGRDRWERVQHQLHLNQSFSSRNTKHDYLLRGLVVCGGCRRRYVGEPGKGLFYYRCSTRCKKRPTVREAVLNESVWVAIEAAVLNPQLIEEQVARVRGLQAKEAQQSHQEAKEVTTLLTQVDEEEGRVVEAYRIGVLPAPLLGREIEQLAGRRTALQKRLAEIEPSGPDVEPTGIKQSIKQYCAEVAERLGTLDITGRQMLLRFLIREILFEGETIVIRGRIPLNERGVEHDGRIVTTTTYCYGRNPAPAIEFELVSPVSVRPRSHPPAEKNGREDWTPQGLAAA